MDMLYVLYGYRPVNEHVRTADKAVNCAKSQGKEAILNGNGPFASRGTWFSSLFGGSLGAETPIFHFHVYIRKHCPISTFRALSVSRPLCKSNFCAYLFFHVHRSLINYIRPFGLTLAMCGFVERSLSSVAVPSLMGGSGDSAFRLVQTVNTPSLAIIILLSPCVPTGHRWFAQFSQDRHNRHPDVEKE